ncbi:MAG: response regulator, partial [Colwellia sp.]|nr:response regulator [Colwellia sp.]
YDLVLTDHSMPIMSGTELAKKILSIRPNLPIILATGYADLMSMDEMNSIGLSACLIKPVRIDELNQTVHKCLTSSIESYVSPINTT